MTLGGGVNLTRGREMGAHSSTQAKTRCAAAEGAPKRLAGWSRVVLKPGKSREASVVIDPKYLSIYDEQQDRWKLVPGKYTFLVGGSSSDLRLRKETKLQ